MAQRSSSPSFVNVNEPHPAVLVLGNSLAIIATLRFYLPRVSTRVCLPDVEASASAEEMLPRETLNHHHVSVPAYRTVTTVAVIVCRERGLTV